MNKKLLVIGNAGLILNNFVKKITYEKEPYNISMIDKINFNASSMYWNKNNNMHIADICDEHIVNTLFNFEQPDYVILGASLENTRQSFINSSDVLYNNILGTQNIINACIKNKVEKLIYLSSASVYGENHTSLFRETDHCNPLTPYAISKRTGEQLILSANKNYNLNYNILRFSNCYGTRQNSKFLIPSIVKSIIHQEDINIYGSGMQLREWTHVFDASAALLKIINSNNINEIYNISSNQEFTNLEVAQKICNHFKTGHDLIKNIEDLPGNVYRKALDTTKIRSLGWSHRNKLNDTIGEIVEWFQLNQFILK